MQLPVAAIESSIFSFWLYFMGGLTLEVGRFFFYLLVAFLSDVFAATLFRCFSLGFPTLEASQTGPMPIIGAAIGFQPIVGVSIYVQILFAAILVVFAGFLVLPSKMVRGERGRNGVLRMAAHVHLRPDCMLQGWMQFIYYLDPYVSRVVFSAVYITRSPYNAPCIVRAGICRP